MAVEDASILADFEEKEKSNPSPRKIDGDRVIYASRKLKKTRRHGRPTLCDFGQARFGSNTYSGDIQPYIYRAPEVLLQMPWNEKVDIWNVGNWKGNVEIPPISLEKLEGFLQGEPQQLFLQFMRKMLKWKDEERESARDLLDDPWLQSV
ncbi:hypothetical protein ATERTT37_004544 [Aspergillus terreus]